MKRIAIMSVVAALVIAGCNGTTTVIDFEDLTNITVPPGTPVNVGDKFFIGTTLSDESSGAKIVVLPFEWSGGGNSSDGYIEITNHAVPGGSGISIRFNNASLGIIAPDEGIVRKVKFKFVDFGGNINLVVNGTLYNEDDFKDITSPLTGNVAMSVSPPSNQGVVQLSGDMDKFASPYPMTPGQEGLKFSAVAGGGQELWIDDLEFSQ